MPKYIKVDNLIGGARDFLSGVLYVRKGRSGGKSLSAVIEIVNRVAELAPAEDVEPVVRCKSCEKRVSRREEKRWWCKPCGYRCNDDEWYCPMGRRAEDGKRKVFD